MEEIKCKQVGQITATGFTEMTGRVYSVDGLSPSIRTFGGGNTEVKIVDDLYNNRDIRVYDDCPSLRVERQGLKVIEPICLNSKVNGKQPSLTDRVYDTRGISTCVTTSQFFMGNIAELTAYDEQNGYLRQDGCVGMLTTDGSTPKHNNRVVEPNYRFYEQAFATLRENDCKIGDTIDAYNKRVNKDGISPTITTRPEGFKTAILPIVENCRIRKLTPRETYRLMGFDNTDFDNAANGGISTANYRRRLNARTMTKTEWKEFYRLTRTQTMSNSQLYKQAGNSIVTTVLMAIFGKLLGIDYETKISELVERLKDDSE